MPFSYTLICTLAIRIKKKYTCPMRREETKKIQQMRSWTFGHQDCEKEQVCEVAPRDQAETTNADDERSGRKTLDLTRSPNETIRKSK